MSRIVLVGDSTVTDKAGWGAGFASYVSSEIDVINTAMGGRSSKSFRDEGRWDRAIAADGDYVLIQFGHNDQPGKGPDRETDPDSTYLANMKRYATEARAAGAKPVIVTSLVRRKFADGGKIKSDLVPYVNAAKRAAEETGAALIDLHALSIAACESLGVAECERMAPVDKEGKVDTTHLKGELGEIIGGLVASELKRIEPSLSPYISETAVGTTVAADGSGAYRTVQAAIDAAPAGRTRPYVIRIAPGTYKEHVTVPREKPFLTLRGRDRATTVLTDDKNVKSMDAAGVKLKTPDSSSTFVKGDDFVAENITFENTSGNNGQGLAMFFEADRGLFRDCRFLGWQDTLRINKGRSYYENCYIAGHVDFIYGKGVAWFERCQIHCLADGFITAASTPEGEKFGYVFMNCRVTAEPGVTRNYLGRPWRPFASVIFLNTELPAAVPPEGWHNWGKAENEKTARYAEYGSTGPGAGTTGRVKWSRQLTREEADAIGRGAVLGGADEWRP